MDFAKLFKDWKSEYITRDALYELTGGMLNKNTMRTYDSHGVGIKGKENVGYNQVVYPVKEVIAYLESRAANKPNPPKPRSKG